MMSTKRFTMVSAPSIHRLPKKELFTTRSGITVTQYEEKLVPENILVYHPRTGQAILNGQHISAAVFQLVLEHIYKFHPDSLVMDNVYNQVFIYPTTS